jgi:cysteinyl-tRNA synthetase
MARVPRIHNSLTRRLQQLTANQDGILTWYTCGPTVYDSAHLGHARTYVSLDIIRRLLTEHFKFDVHLAMGMTDVDDKVRDCGHVITLTIKFVVDIFLDYSTVGRA